MAANWSAKLTVVAALTVALRLTGVTLVIVGFPFAITVLCSILSGIAATPGKPAILAPNYLLLSFHALAKFTQGRRMRKCGIRVPLFSTRQDSAAFASICNAIRSLRNAASYVLTLPSLAPS